MTPEERRTHEQETLKVARENLERVTQSDHVYAQIRDVRLVGEYPATKVEVTYWDPRYSHDYTGSWAIWQKPLYESDDSYEPPWLAGDLIATWALEQ